MANKVKYNLGCNSAIIDSKLKKNVNKTKKSSKLEKKFDILFFCFIFISVLIIL